MSSEIIRDANYKTKNLSVSFVERLAFGCGDLANNVIYAAITTFLLFYYTNVIGVSAAAVGTIMLISRFLDGIADLTMGVIVDRTKSKYGKARPWILRMAVPFAIGAVLLFSVPMSWGNNAKLVYIFITYNLVSTVIYTSINVPYATLNALITQDQYQRSVLSIFRMILATVGTMGIALLTLPMVKLFGNNPRAWSLTFAVFGVVAVFLFLFTFLGTKERVKPANKKQIENNIPIKDGVKALFKNKYWGIITISLVLIFIILTINGGSTIYYAETILGNKDLVGILATAMNLAQIVTMLLLARFIKRYGKRNVMIVGSIITIFAYGVMALSGKNVQILLLGNIIKGFGSGTIIACMFTMVSDTIEYGEWKTGLRTEGLINSASSFGFKVGGGLGAAMIGWILSAGGYVASSNVQSASAIFAIKSLYIYLPMILTVIQIAILLLYKLDKEYPSILQDLIDRSDSN
ncbi:MFS transporter [Clostridium estertheticum]|uniref:MFS transporter n=1 Tax=Clostridium estertheticum TaxID=238834 RepID=UPI001C0BCE90|nr:MFS transporter [Clostridium estertheticum]MBU3184555.1 MFS transporter [Clostridium estertheticum]